MPTARPPLLVIAGPTASGKTRLAVEAALALGAEIVGADSMQIYRGMDIGTATPSAAELRGVPHHLLNCVEPDQPCDAVRFAADADRIIADIARRGRRVIVAGGTGLWLRVLLRGLQRGPAPDPDLRAALLTRAATEGWPALHAELAAADSETAARLHPNDGARILRALEVLRLSGQTITTWQRRHGFSDRRYPALLLGVRVPSEDLRVAIRARAGAMFEAGFVDEVRALLDRGLPRSARPLQGLGYKRVCQHLAGELSIEEAMERTISDTWRFSRRQRTWFGGEPDLEWIPPDTGEIVRRAEAFFRVQEG
jgi:tRNA dimethylallyltransferase